MQYILPITTLTFAAYITESTLNKKEIALRFLLNPVEFLPCDDNPALLGKVVCERTKLEGEPGKQIAVGTGEFETLPAQMVRQDSLPLPILIL